MKLVLQFLDQELSDFLLLRRMIKNHRAILGSSVVSLSIQCCRIVHSEEKGNKVSKGSLMRIEGKVKDLCVACFSTANIIVGGIGTASACIPDVAVKDCVLEVLLEKLLSTPKASCTKGGKLMGRWLMSG